MTMMEMRVMDQTGHTTHKWDSDNEAEVTAARAVFNSMTERGYSAFRIDDKGKKGVRIDSFDPDAEAMTLIPQLKGG